MGGKYRLVTIKKVIDNENIKLTADVASEPIDVGYAESFSFVIEVAGTTPRLKLEYQIIASSEGDGGNVGDGLDAKLNWYTPTTNGILVAEVLASQADGFNPAVSHWIRIKLTGTATNHATDTYATVYIMYQ